MNNQSKAMSSNPQELPDLTMCGECCQRPRKGQKFMICAGCGLVAYCCIACQTKAWSAHKIACKIKKKEKEAREKSKVAAPGSGLGDMGSIMAALMPPPPPKRYHEAEAYSACFLNNHEELQMMLLQTGLDVDWAKPDDKWTAATIAAEKGHDNCLAQLIAKGANLLKLNKQGYATIHVACQSGRYTTVALLLDSGVDASLLAQNVLGNTPAIISSCIGHVKILALLLDRGSDPNLANKHGVTPAHIACEVGHVKCLLLLIKRDANINLRDSEGFTPLDYSRAYKQRDCEDLLLSNHAVGQNPENIPPMTDAALVSGQAK
jgi:ankyrin repeat protein